MTLKIIAPLAALAILGLGWLGITNWDRWRIPGESLPPALFGSQPWALSPHQKIVAPSRGGTGSAPPTWVALLPGRTGQVLNCGSSCIWADNPQTAPKPLTEYCAFWLTRGKGDPVVTLSPGHAGQILVFDADCESGMKWKNDPGFEIAH
jgi:hypothetical protein